METSAAACCGRVDPAKAPARLQISDVLGLPAALKEDFSAGKRDNFLTLNAAQFLISTHPQVYGEGQGADVGCFILVLVPALAEPHLCAVHDQIVKTIDEFAVLMANRLVVFRALC